MWSGAALGNVAQSRVDTNAYVKKVALFLTETNSYLTFNDLPQG